MPANAYYACVSNFQMVYFSNNTINRMQEKVYVNINNKSDTEVRVEHNLYRVARAGPLCSDLTKLPPNLSFSSTSAFTYSCML